ncbi:MAG: 2-oxoglutarate ferredoxin oxidoreductase subunit alpha, partial [Planctomycetales bacterium]|nr:2-oxoglutarate ferredoxin oxidoreductase subunit alpha [Planctomycetales bacterium]
SGPGIALKGEALGLAVILELPMLVINVQRGGPSTGLPTKTEQSDLVQAMFGRNGECPMPVIAAAGPADCFDAAQEAWRIAVRFMTPVMLLTDGYIANGSEPWRIPNVEDLPKVDVVHPSARDNGEPFLPYQRNERLARPWAVPGTAGLEHRLGGLEKQDPTGNVSYDPKNHQHMINTRALKVRNVANDIPAQQLDGPDQGELLVISWGGTYGACATAVHRSQAEGAKVAHCHLRYLNPFPKNLGEILTKFDKVLVPELNLGQLRTILRAEYLMDLEGLNKVEGKPFSVGEVYQKIQSLLS